MKKVELIFVPAPGIGHLVSIIEFAKRLISHQISITILVLKLDFASFLEPYTKSLINCQPNIKLIVLPQVNPPPFELLQKSIETYLCELIERHKPRIKDIISSRFGLDFAPTIGIVLDFFCASMVDIGKELGLPSFIFFTSGLGYLGLKFQLLSRHERNPEEFSFSDSEVSIPGFVNPVPPKVLPGFAFNKDGGYATIIKLVQNCRNAQGIIVNSFTELESYAVETFSRYNGQSPKIYPVGPMLNLKAHPHPHPDMDCSRWENIRNWLDEQSEASVVFLCFGSHGTLSVPQVKEIALGLEHSGHKFLWSLRFPQSVTEETQFKSPEEMLPDGFLERINGRGLICGWAPQAAVLAHKAIRGFISHCGWNSILESLWFGVPIATLPLYAEQRFNAFTIVKELGLAVELKTDYWPETDELKEEEVKRALKSLMENDSEVRKKVKNMAEMARNALEEGGSSFNSISQFINDLTS